MYTYKLRVIPLEPEIDPQLNGQLASKFQRGFNSDIVDFRGQYFGQILHLPSFINNLRPFGNGTEHPGWVLQVLPRYHRNLRNACNRAIDHNFGLSIFTITTIFRRLRKRSNKWWKIRTFDDFGFVGKLNGRVWNYGEGLRWKQRFMGEWVWDGGCGCGKKKGLHFSCSCNAKVSTNLL